MHNSHRTVSFFSHQDATQHILENCDEFRCVAHFSSPSGSIWISRNCLCFGFLLWLSCTTWLCVWKKCFPWVGIFFSGTCPHESRYERKENSNKNTRTVKSRRTPTVENMLEEKVFCYQLSVAEACHKNNLILSDKKVFKILSKISTIILKWSHSPDFNIFRCSCFKIGLSQPCVAYKRVAYKKKKRVSPDLFHIA